MVHDDYKNKYSFKIGDQTYVLSSLPLKKIHEDQISLTIAMEEQKQKEAKSIKKKKERRP